MEPIRFKLALYHAFFLGVSILLVALSTRLILAALINGSTPRAQAVGSLILGGVILVTDCIVFGLSSLFRRVVAAGLVCGEISIALGIIGLLCSHSPFGYLMSTTKSVVWMVAGIALFALFRVIKAVAFSKMKFEYMTTKDESPTR